MEIFPKIIPVFELNHPLVWCLPKDMKQKLLRMHLPTDKIIEHYSLANRLSTDRVSNSSDYGQGKVKNIRLTSYTHHRYRTKQTSV